MRESKNLEFKESVSDSFLKTVCAFANFNDGQIIFGVDDDGNEVGINDISGEVLSIENKINDTIRPIPNYNIMIDEKKRIIILSVEKSDNPPYYYKSKSYMRNDTSTVEIDRDKLNYLILEGQNKTYDSLKYKNQELKFDYLLKKLNSVLGIENFSIDLMKTLELYSDDAYNNAAGLLADKNDYNGVDIIKFGESINILQDRRSFDKVSILEQYDLAVEVFNIYYHYEEIVGTERIDKYKIPLEAFRESLANALVHRNWAEKVEIEISMFDDRIELVSPGGLPNGITEEEYLNEFLSKPRNPIIANVFFRLKLIERFGTGIKRIRDEYKGSVLKPQFKVSDNMIKITLPLYKEELGTNELQNKIFDILKDKKMSSSDIIRLVGKSKSTVVKELNNMLKQGYIKTEGNGRSTKYFISK